MNYVGMKIKEIRLELGLTMEEFGKKIDEIHPASDSIVSIWERGVSLPNNDRLPKIAKLGNITVAELLGSNPLEQYTTTQLVEELNKRGYDRKEI